MSQCLDQMSPSWAWAAGARVHAGVPHLWRGRGGGGGGDERVCHRAAPLLPGGGPSSTTHTPNGLQLLPLLRVHARPLIFPVDGCKA